MCSIVFLCFRVLWELIFLVRSEGNKLVLTSKVKKVSFYYFARSHVFWVVRVFVGVGWGKFLDLAEVLS